MARIAKMSVADTIDSLNLARTQAGLTASLPEFNSNNIQYIQDLDGWSFNAFTGMVDKITRMYGFRTAFTDADNPFYAFMRESLPVGTSIEEYYIPLIEGYTPDFTGQGVLDPIPNNILKRVYSLNFPIQFGVTTSIWQSRGAFLTIEGVNNLQNQLIANMYDSASAALYKNSAKLFSDLPAKGCAVEQYGYSVDTSDNIGALLKGIRTAVDNMVILQDGMNSAGIEQRSYRNELILVTTPEVYQNMTVDFLAGVFNITYANADTRVILISDKNLRSNPYSTNLLALVVDPRNLIIFKGREYAGSIVNPKGVFENTFLTQDFCFNVTNWWNTVAFFSGAAPTYTLTTNEVGGTGTVTFSPVSPVAFMTDVNIKITPPASKNVSALQVDGVDVKYDVTDGYTFKMPNHNVAVTVTYA